MNPADKLSYLAVDEHRDHYRIVVQLETGGASVVIKKADDRAKIAAMLRLLAHLLDHR